MPMRCVLLLLSFASISIMLRWKKKEATSDTGPGYLIALPYQGSANQLSCLIRAAIVAKQTGRILLVPKLYPSKHDSFVEGIAFNHFIDMTASFDNVKLMSAEDFLNDNYVSSCIAYGKWTTFDGLGEPGKSFAQKFNIEHLEWYDWPRPPNAIDHLMSVLTGKVECIANLQHISFGNIDNQIAKLKFRSANQHDLAVHWRRGDFGQACRNKNLTSCWPSMARLRKEIQGFDDIVIYSNDKQELIANALSAYYASDESPGGVFNDMARMIAAKAFIGNRYSTISRIVRVIRDSRGMNNTKYF